MQVNLHGSPCIPGVFLYCFSHRKKTKFNNSNNKKKIIIIIAQAVSSKLEDVNLKEFSVQTKVQ